MSYNNFNAGHNKISRDSQRNYTNFIRISEQFSDVGKTLNLLSNTSDIENKIKTLLDNAYINEGETHHLVMVAILENCKQISTKPQKSLEDITNFFTSYGNFIDIHNSLKGEESQ